MNAGDVVSFYTMEIKLLAEKVIYNDIIPTDVLWLEHIHSLAYYEAQSRQQTAPKKS